jgi:hypothetical protein
VCVPRGLVFIHVPKAAGTTLRRIIARQYPPETLFDAPFDGRPFEIPAHRRSTVRVLQGHLPFGCQEQIDAPVDLVTVLREPVDRVRSLYDYIQRRPGHVLRGLVEERTLEEFAASGHAEVRNMQVRLVSGCRDVDGRALETAKRNLATRFAAFGLVERFDESLVLMKRALGWGSIYYRAANVARSPTVERGAPSAAVSRIERENELDLELYAFARERLRHVLESQDEAFWRALRAFRRVNPLYAAASRPLYAVGRFAPEVVRRRVRAGRAALRW